MSRTVRRGAKLSYVYFDWQHWAVIAGAVLLAVWCLTTGVRPILSGYEAARDVVAKTRQYQRLVAENRRMEDQLRFLATPEGQDYAARAEIGYVGADEQVLAIEIAREPSGSLSLGDRTRRWLDGAADRAENWGRDTRDFVNCLIGRWQPVMPAETPGGMGNPDG